MISQANSSLYSPAEKRLIREFLRYLVTADGFSFPGIKQKELVTVIQEASTLWDSFFGDQVSDFSIGPWTIPMLKRVLDCLLIEGMELEYDGPPVYFTNEELRAFSVELDRKAAVEAEIQAELEQSMSPRS